MENKENKNELIQIRVKADHKANIKRIATNKGLNISEYILYCIMKDITETELLEQYKE